MGDPVELDARSPDGVEYVVRRIRPGAFLRDWSNPTSPVDLVVVLVEALRGVLARGKGWRVAVVRRDAVLREKVVHVETVQDASDAGFRAERLAADITRGYWTPAGTLRGRD